MFYIFDSSVFSMLLIGTRADSFLRVCYFIWKCVDNANNILESKEKINLKLEFEK